MSKYSEARHIHFKSFLWCFQPKQRGFVAIGYSRSGCPNILYKQRKYTNQQRAAEWEYTSTMGGSSVMIVITFSLTEAPSVVEWGMRCVSGNSCFRTNSRGRNYDTHVLQNKFAQGLSIYGVKKLSHFIFILYFRDSVQTH